LSPNTGFLGELVRLNKIGEIQVDLRRPSRATRPVCRRRCHQRPGKQIIIAAGDGAKAALGAYSYLMRLPEVVDWGQSRRGNPDRGDEAARGERGGSR